MERPDYSALTKVLEEMNREGKFYAAVLARDDGLEMAHAVSPRTSPDVVAAMSGYVASTVERMRKDLELGEVKDIVVRCSAGKAVIRKIGSKGEQSLLVAAIMPRNIRYHSRAIGKGATQIRQIMRYRR
jgi:predicted regulator of Ras-like GTPase activity (Roadblock/LC7/MglB family)